MLSGLVINKAVSVYIGPAGLAVIGQFQNFSQIALILSQGAINSGVVKYTAEYRGEEKKLSILFSTALKVTLFSSLAVGVILIIFSSYWAVQVLSNIDYTFVFILFGITIVLFAVNNLFLSILNGLKKIKYYIKINIIQSIYSLIFTSLLIMLLGLKGALIALVTNQSIIFFISLFLINKYKLINWHFFTKNIDIGMVKRLIAFSVMAITSAIMVPSSQFIVRNYISSTQGLEQAGYWQGVWYVSTTYLLIITTTLSVYYLPRLSEIKNYIELKREILQGYKILLPLTIFFGVIIYCLRDLIIFVLFSNNFEPMKPLFTWQIIGDGFKIASWLLAYIMLAKAMTVIYLITEILFSLGFVFLSIILVDNFHTIGVTYAYCLNYVIYFIVISIIISFKLKRSNFL
ncbi:O-antigen translocase [Arsenophonus nasoniae]|uniref:O-antigen translocase n=1 Tax=Arsenophonus nasoniae TaxID=638 RepID=A0AA95GDV4_9GAMM|nr:O-antigen translocase [Arsenophonus nasoniae]WGL95360.1 O-antigen translocase [Arsenophonus nasoniae]